MPTRLALPHPFLAWKTKELPSRGRAWAKEKKRWPLRAQVGLGKGPRFAAFIVECWDVFHSVSIYCCRGGAPLKQAGIQQRRKAWQPCHCGIWVLPGSPVLAQSSRHPEPHGAGRALCFVSAGLLPTPGPIARWLVAPTTALSHPASLLLGSPRAESHP